MNTLVRLVMFSEAAFPIATSSSEIESDLIGILSQSRRANAQRGITGVLYYGDGCFLHCMEGEQEEISRVMNRMATDPRHHNLEVVMLEPIEHLSFSQWRMRFIRTDHSLRQVLQQHDMASFQPYQFSLLLVGKLVDMAAQPDYQRCA